MVFADGHSKSLAQEDGSSIIGIRRRIVILAVEQRVRRSVQMFSLP